MGLTYRFLGDFDKATIFYENAIAIDPKFAPAFNGLGIVRQLQGRWDSAISALKTSIELDPQYTSSWNSLGLTYQKTGRIKEALEAYGHAQEAAFENVFGRFNNRPDFTSVTTRSDGTKTQIIGENYLRLFREGLRADPMYATILNNIGTCYASTGDTKSARDAYHEAIEFIPDGSDYREPIKNLAALDSQDS